MDLLDGKCTVVTGSTKGIGRAIAVEYVRFGARVLLNHRGRGEDPAADEHLQETIQQIKSLGGYEPKIIAADMTREEEVSALAQAAVEELGSLDIWVNNVGLHLVAPAFELSGDEWERLFRINLTSSFLGCREAAAIMRKQGGGKIINITSKMGIVGCAENACYCAAKAGVKMMTECLAAEWARYGIQVNAIAPGVTLTDPTFKVIKGKPEVEASLCYRTPMGRMAEPEEIGKAAVFLASDLSSYVTGATLSCDGGWVAESDFSGVPAEKLETWKKEYPKLA